MPRRDDVPRYVALALSKAPGAALRVGWSWLRVKKKAQRAEKLFRKRLEAAGMEKELARRLAERYASTVKLRKLMREFGVSGGILNGNNR